MKHNRRVHLLSVYDVPVAAVVETLQVDYEVLRQGMQTHSFISQFVILAGGTVPSILLGQLLGLAEAFNQLLHGQLVLHPLHKRFFQALVGIYRDI